MVSTLALSVKEFLLTVSCQVKKKVLHWSPPAEGQPVEDENSATSTSFVSELLAEA
jgi:hypothetical protein